MNDIIVDVIKDTGNQITVSQNDNLTKTYKLIVTKNSTRYDLSNKKVRFAFLKNGTNLGDIVEELTISDAANGVVDFPITSTITRENGVFTCGLAIFNDSGYMENTAFFNMLVKESLFEKISGGLIDEGVYGEILSLLEKGEKLQKKLEPLVPRAEKITEPLQKAVEDAEVKKPQLDASIESAREFIENLDGSQNLPQMREDITELQNGLKSNQELAYEGTNLKCENTLDGRIEDIVLEGMTYQNLLSEGQSALIAPTTIYTFVPEVIKGVTYELQYLDGSVIQTGITKVTKITTGLDVKGGIRVVASDGLQHKNMLLEGDYTNKYIPPYFGGIKSVGETEENKVNICSNDKESKEAPRDKKELNLPFEGGLKGLPNIKDLIYNKEDGCYVKQNIGKVILNGSEKWIRRTMASENNTIGFGLLGTKVSNYKPGQGLCDKFLVNKDADITWNTDIECLSNADFIQLRILKSKLETQDIEGFKKWLSQNPITVYHELAKPVETKISDTKLSLDTYNALTYVFSNNTVSPNIKLKVASNLGSIIQQNSKSINDIYKLIDEVIIPQLTTNSADIQVLKIK